MKYIYTALVLLLISSTSLVAQQKWTAVSIPAELKENAHAVIRTNETVFTVKNIGESTAKVHTVITILDEQGLKYAIAYIGYDKLHKVIELDGTLFDAYGEKVKRLKKDDIEDKSSVSGYSLFEDNRYKKAKFTYANFPFTVEFTYETTSKNMLFYQSWFPQEDEENVSVEKSSFKVIMPTGIELRHKEINGMAAPVIENIETGKSYTWSAKNMKIFEYEPFSPKWSHVGMGVLTAPSEFEVEGYRGKMNTWKEFGEWQNQLNKDRDVLPENTKQEVQKLIANLTDPKEKVKKIYEYLQAKTRYVSIQLGIGGWQPFEAKEVAEKGYGDCKALTNYTKALLKSVGIPSLYATIKAGKNERDVIADFPSSQFNHVILCIPMPKDSIWLECTSQHESFGYLSSFTSNRYAFLATPEGGKLVRTPSYGEKENQQITKAEVVLTEDGNASAEATTIYSGILQDEFAYANVGLDAEEKKKFILKSIEIPSFELIKYTIENKKDIIPSSTVKLSLQVQKYASKSGTRMFLNPNLLSITNPLQASSKPRTSEIELQNAYTEIDSVVCQLPTKAIIEAQSPPIKIETSFGSYESEIKIKDQKTILFPKVHQKKRHFPSK